MKNSNGIHNISLQNLSDEARKYLQVHTKRYQYLLAVVQNVRGKLPQNNLSILDIGPSVFTRLLEEHFPKDEVLSLGLEHELSRGGHLPLQFQFDDKNFFRFNLNDVQYPEKWIELPKCNLIIMAEVLEHLFTAPTLVLNFLKAHIKDSGYLIIQTPNAASLKNRLMLLFGRNPYEMIRENADNPGHFHEYTPKELISIAEKTGFEVIRMECRSYFNPVNWLEKIYIMVNKVLPQSFHDGITLVLRKVV